MLLEQLLPGCLLFLTLRWVHQIVVVIGVFLHQFDRLWVEYVLETRVMQRHHLFEEDPDLVSLHFSLQIRAYV